MKSYPSIKRFRVDDYLAEVDVTMNEHDGREYDTMTLSDIRKLETVRKALEKLDLTEVAKHARLFRVQPVQPKPTVGTDAA